MSNHPAQRRGFVLLMVMVVILLASMVAVSLLFRMNAEIASDTATSSSEQAWAAAFSGVQQAIRIAGSAPLGSLDWRDQPAVFQQQFVTDDGVDRWYFSVYNSADSSDGEVRFGLTDEACKLNVNQLDAAAAEKLPLLSPALGQGLLDFIDTDSDTRPEGAEQPEYTLLGRPYAVRNANLATLGQMLLVRGFTPALVYGEDARLLQRLGISTNSPSGPSSSSAPEDKRPGLVSWLTVSSYDLNISSSRIPRVNLNDAGGSLTNLDLPEAVISFVEALHSNKTAIAHPADLLDAKLTVKDAAGHDAEIESKVGKEELPVLLDRTTATNADRLIGLININTAPAPVLQTLPGLDLSLAESIVAARRALDTELRKTPAWVFTQGILDTEQFKKIAPRLTARSFQFSFRVIGYGLPSGRYRVLEAIVDVGASRPAITYLRDLTRLGLPFHVGPEEEQKNG